MTTHTHPIETYPDSGHAHRPAGRTVEPGHPRHPAAGPTPDLVALPTRRDLEPTAPADEITAYLSRVEEARRRQLAALPAVGRDLVAAAHRGAVERILAEIATARRRAEAGLYGVCAVCSGTIAGQRLEVRPWATTCARCADREVR